MLALTNIYFVVSRRDTQEIQVVSKTQFWYPVDIRILSISDPVVPSFCEAILLVPPLKRSLIYILWVFNYILMKLIYDRQKVKMRTNKENMLRYSMPKHVLYIDIIFSCKLSSVHWFVFYIRHRVTCSEAAKSTEMLHLEYQDGSQSGVKERSNTSCGWGKLWQQKSNNSFLVLV